MKPKLNISSFIVNKNKRLGHTCVDYWSDPEKFMMTSLCARGQVSNGKTGLNLRSVEPTRNFHIEHGGGGHAYFDRSLKIF